MKTSNDTTEKDRTAPSQNPNLLLDSALNALTAARTAVLNPTPVQESASAEAVLREVRKLAKDLSHPVELRRAAEAQVLHAKQSATVGKQHAAAIDDLMVQLRNMFSRPASDSEELPS
jgi:hypothetical protein